MYISKKNINKMKIINKFKRKIKDEVMLYEYHARGDLESMKKQSKRFDRIFLSLQIRIIILVVSIAISVSSFVYLTTINISLYYSIPLTLLLIYLVKTVLSAVAKVLIKLSGEEQQ